MKLPDIFIPDRSLEENVNDLTKGCKLQKIEEPAIVSIQDIVRKGERVAEKFGKFGSLYFSNSYKFKNKETNLKIRYTPGCWPETMGSLRVYLKKSFFKKEKVFEFSRDHKEPLRRYIPGEWEKDLEKLYSRT